MKIKFSYIFFLLFFFCSNIGYSQIKYEALIVDGITNKVIMDANIKIVGSTKGTNSDKDGMFELTFDQLPTTIVVSHIAYEEERREISVVLNSQEVIYLYPRNDRLTEITIKAENKVEALSEVESYSVQDFEIVGNKIFRLEFHNHIDKFKLSITDLDGEILQVLSLKKFKGVHSLFKSCNGIVYVLAKFHAYSLTEIDFRFELGAAIVMDKFKRNIEPCKLRIHDKLFFVNEMANGLVKKITSYDINKEAHELISVVAEQELLEGFYQDLSLMNTGQNITSMLATTTEENCRIRTMQASSDFLWTVFYKPEYPINISSLKENTIVFNHVQRKIEFYNEFNERVSEVEIDYVLDDKWLKEIRIDVRSQKAYGIFNLKTGIGIKHINLESGEVRLVGIVETPFQNYSKIEVFNNSIFYLNDTGKDGANMELMKFDL